MAGTDFLLLRLFHHIQAPNLLFPCIFLVFLITLVGNIMMIILIWLDSRLHTPMYFLLSQLSIMGLLYSSTFVSKIANDFLSGKNTISFVYCGIQLILFTILCGTECLLLAVMAYGRYVAICHPLCYSILMCLKVLVLVLAGTWFCALFNALVHGIYTLNLPYCASREIHHFFFEFPEFLKLVCADTSLYENWIYVISVVFFLSPFSAIMASYGQIFSTVLRLKSNSDEKVIGNLFLPYDFAVTLLWNSNIQIFSPKAYHTAEQDEVVSVFYTIIPPMLNPFIYSLQSKDVAGAPGKLWESKTLKFGCILRIRQEKSSLIHRKVLV